MTADHEYLSTACVHGECGSCRQTCKYCDASCRHGCHLASGSKTAPVSWVDQARGVAIRLHDVLQAVGVDLAASDRHLARAIREDPSLFWVRGEAMPPGEWRDTGRETR